MKHRIAALTAALSLVLATSLLSGCEGPGTQPSASQNTAVTHEQKTQTVKRVIYRADGKGTEKLKAVEVEIGAHEKNPYLVVLKRLVEKAPKEETTFPKGLSVKDVTVKDGIASVDFNDVFLSRRHNDYDNTMMVYAVVNTLTEFKDVKKVEFLVDGKPVEVLGQMDLSDPLSREESFLVKK